MQVDEQLRNATIAVLRERGWDGLTLERVAEVAGRARSTLWRQGLDRDALIAALTGALAADAVETADVAFNAVAWTYVHLRGRHNWPAETATDRVVDLVLNGIAGAARPVSTKIRRKESR